MMPAHAPRRAALALAAFAALLVWGCITAGGGTDVGNPEMVRVTGSFMRPDGSPASDLALHLRPRDYLLLPDAPAAPPAPGSFQDRRTDSQGFFTFDSVPRGLYRIETTDSSGRGALIDLDATGNQARIALKTAILASTGSIEGSLNYLGVVRGTYPKIAIAVYGTDRLTYATSDGKFVLGNLPAGAYRLHVSTDSSEAEVPEARVEPGGRTQVGPVNIGP